MRHPDQQTHDDQTEVIRSEPVAVPAPDDADSTETHRTPQQGAGAVYDSRQGEQWPEDALDERGSYDQNRDDQLPEGAERSGGSVDPDGPVDRDDDAPDGGADRDGDDDPDRTMVVGTDESDTADRDSLSAAERAEIADLNGAEPPAFHDPAALPTAFGATSVGSGVAAAALAGETRNTEHDVRDEDPDRSVDGATDDRATEPVPAETDATAQDSTTEDRAAEDRATEDDAVGDSTTRDGTTGDRVAGDVADGRTARIEQSDPQAGAAHVAGADAGPESIGAAGIDTERSDDSADTTGIPDDEAVAGTGAGGETG